MSKLTGRCYCGATKVVCTQQPQIVAYCHCVDCRRATGAPVAAFAAFAEASVLFEPDEGKPVSVNPGVTSTFCADCGTSLTGRYDYLPGTVYIALGMLDQADRFGPQLHAHDSSRLSWLSIDDNCKRVDHSARDVLNAPDA